MHILQLAIDLCLIITLLGLAWGVLFSRDDFRAVVLFIALGLLMALTWSRLAAPEVALAEAAIGAGISGALLLSALPRLRERHRQQAASGSVAAVDHGVTSTFLRPAGPASVAAAGLVAV
ncbi:MAG: hydrogenase subunit MbhD domain-containing protein [Desulfurivibrio sp.]|nr:hydrogenase subunit MbhD domain-containing protein [Desulfurivibrio sp.]